MNEVKIDKCKYIKALKKIGRIIYNISKAMEGKYNQRSGNIICIINIRIMLYCDEKEES